MDHQEGGLEERRFHTGTVEINYAEGPPSGPPFLVLHGGSGRWQYGSAFAHALSSDWHVFALDLRGHGKSGHVPGHYRIRDFADDIGAFLGEVVREPAVIYGHSLGARVAIMTAVRHPAFVRGVIDGDGGIGPFQPRTESDINQNTFWYELAASGQSEDEIKQMLKETPLTGPGTGKRGVDVLGEDNEWFDLHAQSLHQLDPDVLWTILNQLEDMFEGYDHERMFPAIQCPVLVLRADGSGMRDEDVARALARLREPTVVQLQGLGHILHSGTYDPSRPRRKNVQQVLDAITPFLRHLPEPFENRA